MATPDEQHFSIKTIEMDEILSSPHLHAIARSLTIGSSSGMNKALNYYQVLSKDRSIKAKGIFGFYDEVHVGWALLTYERDGVLFFPKEGHACIQVYVREDYRRKGIGASLLRKAEQLKEADTTLLVYAEDAYDFFAPFILINSFQSICY